MKHKGPGSFLLKFIGLTIINLALGIYGLNSIEFTNITGALFGFIILFLLGLSVISFFRSIYLFIKHTPNTQKASSVFLYLFNIVFTFFVTIGVGTVYFMVYLIIAIAIGISEG